jgi:comEA protein
MMLKKSDQWVIVGLSALVLATALSARAVLAPEPKIAHFVARLSEPLDINTATREELIDLPGIGPVLAQRIIEYRETHGGFKSVEELLEIRGIGPKKLAQVRERVRVGSP